MHPARVCLGPFRAYWLHPMPRPVAADGATPSATPIAAPVECVLQAKPYWPARVGPHPVAAPYGLPAQGHNPVTLSYGRIIPFTVVRADIRMNPPWRAFPVEIF